MALVASEKKYRIITFGKYGEKYFFRHVFTGVIFFSNIVYSFMNHFMERDYISCRCKCAKRTLSK